MEKPLGEHLHCVDMTVLGCQMECGGILSCDAVNPWAKMSLAPEFLSTFC